MVGQAAWFFGTLYEGLVGMPQLLADARGGRSPGLLAAGSPVRYFAPVAAIARGPTAVTLAEDWRVGTDRRLIAATATGVGHGAGRLECLPDPHGQPALLAGNEPLAESERHKLVATWHRVNVVRLATLADALISLSDLPYCRRRWATIGPEGVPLPT